MAKVTIGFGVVLIGLGLFGYFGATADKPSVTALIPAFFGLPMAICGAVALNEKLLKHAMHGAVLIGLLGALASGGRGLMKVGALFSTDPDVNRRAIILVLIMAVICTVFVALCVKSFIDARKRKQLEAAAEGGDATTA